MTTVTMLMGYGGRGYIENIVTTVTIVTDIQNDACGLLLQKIKIMILRKTQNPNDVDDANDAESGIWV